VLCLFLFVFAADNESTRMLVRRLNTVRRAAVAEVAQLKAQCAQLRRDLEEGGGGAVAELKQQMANMKEDNARRMKALATARTEKSGFETSAMQWKNEAAQNLENTKR
jgi:TolA-binding protein